ncbi:MAG: hypothetical protein IKP00_02305 [Victivallales bacterium]|nr:hypothetical protein [Victivallales bacterium]
MFSAELWDGLASSCKMMSRQKNASVTMEQGRVVFKADMEPQKDRYMQFAIETTPFRMGDKSLSLRVHNRKPREGSCFYVKGVNKEGKIVISFYTQNALSAETELVLVPEEDRQSIRWFASDIRAPLEDEIVSLRFFQHCTEEADLEIAVSDIKLVPTPEMPKPIEAKDYGMTVKGGTARGVFAVAADDGREYVLVWLMDNLNKRNLQIDIETGETTVVTIPNTQHGDAVYSSILASNGKCYTEFGNRFYEYDVTKKAFTADFGCTPHQAAMSMCEGPDGVVWAAIYPDCGLVSYNPKDGKFTDYGSINQENWAQYPRTMVAGKDGWIYVGIGETRGQIVAFNPVTREAKPLLSLEERPAPSSFYVRLFTDGVIYGRYYDNAYRLENGKAIKTTLPENETMTYQRTGTQGYVLRDFPSGRTLKNLDLMEGELEIGEKDGSVRKVKFEFENLGIGMMAIDVTEDGIVGGGGFFPFRFGTLNPATGAKTDERCDLQCNTIVAHGKYFYIGGYSGGQVVRLDPTKPWTLAKPMSLKEQNLDTNPRYYGKAHPDVNRPHCIAVSPDGRYCVMGGTPSYGLTGGGIAIVDLESNAMTVIGHKQLAENEAPSAVTITKGNLVVIGTTTAPGTGGERLATTTSLMIYDIVAKKLLWKELFSANAEPVNGLYALPFGKVIGLAGSSRLFLFDVSMRKVEKSVSIGEYGGIVGAQGPRVFMNDGDRVYVLQHLGLGLLDTENCAVKEFYYLPGPISTGGGIHNGVFYYASGTHWKSAVIE